MTIREKLKLMDEMRKKNEQAMRMMGIDENSIFFAGMPEAEKEGAEDV